jgi:hypothetical protein
MRDRRLACRRRPRVQATRSAAPVALERRFLAEGAEVAERADVWQALRHPDGRVMCVLSATLARGASGSAASEGPR